MTGQVLDTSRGQPAGSSTWRQDWPVFIISSMRSGSTLLRHLLNSHERLACPPESHFILGVEAFTDYPHALLALRGMGFSAEELRLAVKAFIETFFRKYAERAGKPRWVDKTANYHLVLPFLERVFAREILYVFLVRHPLDCISSLEEHMNPSASDADPEIARVVRTYGKGKYAWAQYWVEVYSKVALFAKSYPERSHVLRYEHLVSSPEATLADVLKFLGEDPARLHLSEAFRSMVASGHGDRKVLNTSAVHTSSVGRWRCWPASEAQAVWELIYPVAKQFDYSLN